MGRKTMRIISIMLTIIVLVGVSMPMKANAKKKDNSQSFSDLGLISQGDLITFGAYEQDNNEKNGKEPIEWVVLKAQNDKMLVVSRCVLEKRKFHDNNQIITWGKSSLRKWLNNTFLTEAFDKAERRNILETTNSDSEKDKVFVLSAEDVQNPEYGFDLEDGSESISRTCMSTFHVSKGMWNRTCSWWLQSFASEENSVVYVDYAGGINNSGTSPDSAEIGVRPAMWISADSKGINRLNKCENIIADEVLYGIVKLGTWHYLYSNFDEGTIPIEWVVLDVKDGKALLLSKYVLDRRQFNSKSDFVTWETSSLRRWLNEDFYNNAFNKNDMKYISETNVRTFDNWYTGVEGGNDTSDKIFILSTDEILNPEYGLVETENKQDEDWIHDDKFGAVVKGCWNLHKEEMTSKCDYGVYDEESYYLPPAVWWTRTPGDSNKSMIYGETYIDHWNADKNVDYEYGIRPAMWIDIPMNESVPEDSVLRQNNKKVEKDAEFVYQIDTKKLKQGDSVFFGVFEQDLDKGPDPIEWKILRISGKRALLLSNYILRFMGWGPYEWIDKSSYITWKDCQIRQWLNDDFYKEAFDDLEKDMIIETDNTWPANTSIVGRVSDGYTTKDNVFLLSVDDVLNPAYGFSRDYLFDKKRVCVATEYACKHGSGVTRTTFNGGSKWFLRSPGYDSVYNEDSWSYISDYSKSATVSPGFGLDDYEGAINSSDGDWLGLGINGVRPAIWIELPEEQDKHSELVIYDRKGAANFAKTKYNDGHGACAAFVSRCLAAGGLSEFGVPDEKYGYVIPKNSGLGGCGNLRKALLKDGLTTEIIPDRSGYLNQKDYPEIKIGDVVIWKNHDGKGDVWVHAAIISDFDKKGNALFSMHNNPHKDKKFKIQSFWGTYNTKTDEKTEKNPDGISYDSGHTVIGKDGSKKTYYSRLCDLYVYHIND